jgi:hypothetical protein
MMTWKEFEKRKADKAFEIAVSICQKRTPIHGALPTSDIVLEQQLILQEWWDDYQEEHV